MKKINSICLILSCILASATFSHADYNVLNRETFTEQIGNGVTYTEDLLLTERGHISVRILEGSVTGGTSIGVLSNPYVNKRSTLSELAGGEPSAIGLINGDFFDTGLSASMGPLVKDGVLLSSSIGDPSFNAAWADSEGMLQIGEKFDESYTINNPLNEKEIAVSYINKPYLEPGKVIVYNASWQGLPPQKPDSVYMGISDGKVESFVTSVSEFGDIKPDFIVAARGGVKTELMDAFKENQRASLDINIKPSLSDIANAIGGGSILLDGGNLPESFSLPISGLHPRTALGINEKGDRFYLLAVDGRNPSATGMSETELALYMKSLGIWTAINLDGGGSTQMMARRLGQSTVTIANTPSGGTERRIANAIAVISPQESLAPYDFKIAVSNDKVAYGTSRKLETHFFDKNFNPAIDDSNSIDWLVQGNGTVENGRFYPGETGQYRITGTYKGNSRSINLTCVGETVGLRLAPRSISLDLGETAEIEAVVHTAQGYDIPVDLQDLSISFPDRLGELKGQTFTASNRAASGKITATFQGNTDEIPVSIGYSSFVFNDFESAGDTFSAYPDAVTGSYGLDETIIKNGESSGLMAYDFTKTDATRAAYVNIDHTLYSTPSHLGLWVKGDQGGGHWLRARIKDSDGKTSTIDLARYVDWTGWRFVEAKIPQSAVFPVKLEKVYLVETDPENKTEGRIWLDDLTAFYKTPYSGQLNSTGIKVPDDKNLMRSNPENPDLSITVLGNTSPVSTLLDRLIHISLSKLANESDFLVSSGTLSEELEKRITAPVIGGEESFSLAGGKNLLVLRLDNSSQNGLRASNPAQIPWLRNKLENASEKNILLSMSYSWKFSDPLEEELVLGWLEDYRTRTGGKTYAATPSQDGEMHTEMKNGLKIIKAPSTPDVKGRDIFSGLDIMTIYMTEEGLKYTVDPIYKRP